VSRFFVGGQPPCRQGLAGGCRLARRNGPFGSVAGAVLQANTGHLATAGGRSAHLSIFVSNIACPNPASRKAAATTRGAARVGYAGHRGAPAQPGHALLAAAEAQKQPIVLLSEPKALSLHDASRE